MSLASSLLTRLLGTAAASALGLSLVFAASAAHAFDLEPVIENEQRVVYSTEGQFDFYFQMLEEAITAEGLVINNRGHVADMLDRTAGQEHGEGIYLHGMTLDFCSATYSRATMEADAHHMTFCPYVIAIYEMTEEPGTIYVGYQRLPEIGDEASQKSLRDVNELLDRIVNNALAF